VAGGVGGGIGLTEKAVLERGGHGLLLFLNKNGQIKRADPRVRPLCCFVDRYFYCFKLAGVKWQVFASLLHRSTVGDKQWQIRRRDRTYLYVSSCAESLEEVHSKMAMLSDDHDKEPTFLM